MRFIFAGDNKFDVVSNRLHDRSRAHKVFLPLDWREVANHPNAKFLVRKTVCFDARKLLNVDAIVNRDYSFICKDSL